MERLLGPAEQLFWLSDRWDPKHFVLCVQIAGRIDPERLATALLAAQVRHPALRAGIVQNAYGDPSFVADASGPVPLSVTEYDGDEAALRALIAAELARPIAPETAPLMRCALLNGDEVSELLLIIHHTIADGLSTATLAFELLAASPAPAPLAPPAFGPPLERRLGLDPKPIRSALRAAPSARNDAARRWIDSRFLWPAELDTLVERCRLEGTTVQSALCVAFARAIEAETSSAHPFRCLCPVDGREACGVGREEVGLFLNYVLTPDLRGQDPFWDSARAVRPGLVAAQQREALAERSFFLDHLLRRRRTPAELCSTLDALAGHRIVISNLGRLGEQPKSVSKRVRAIRLFLNAESRPSVGVATLNGHMHLTLCAYDPMPGLLDRAIRHLMDAARRPGWEEHAARGPELAGRAPPAGH